MKRKSFLERLTICVRVLFRYTAQHAMSLSSLDGQYIMRSQDPEKSGQELINTISIRAYGNVYEVTQSIYQGEVLIKEETRLATYGWHSNGHLIEIGGYRFWIFNPLAGLLYVEDYDEEGFKYSLTYNRK